MLWKFFRAFFLCGREPSSELRMPHGSLPAPSLSLADALSQIKNSSQLCKEFKNSKNSKTKKNPCREAGTYKIKN